MGKLLEERRAETISRIREFQTTLSEAQRVCREIACVYATGSFARGEANRFSDLDLFIVGEEDEATRKRTLSKLDEIVLKADLISATRKMELPEFSGDGEYLAHYTVGQLVTSLGKPEDDVTNTFTARLLLLLESLPLVGESAYQRATETVVSAYWRDYEDHKDDFMPAFLANDILRMWRTFCVNYEARTKTEPAEQKAKRKLKNYKLKHSRLLTCYSALLYLTAIYSKQQTVSPNDVLTMISMTPTQRIEWMLTQGSLVEAHPKLKQLIQLYERFLESTASSEADLIAKFLDKEEGKKYLSSAYQFGDVMFETLNLIGKGSLFHRLLVV